MKVLVTGGAGYIGSHTIVELLLSGFDVCAIDNFSNSFPFVIDNIKKITKKNFSFENIDVTDNDSLVTFINKEKPQAIIHFAAHKSVTQSIKNPLAYYNNNIVGLLNVLSACKLLSIDKLIFSSSAAVYGNSILMPVTEQTETAQQVTPYGNTKKIAEEIIKDVTKASNLNAICLRYFNPCGAHSSGLIGELPIGIPNNLIPYITQTGIGIRTELSIYGNDYNTPDGTAIRDYIHVVDLAKAHVSALNRNQKEKFEVFNIGTGNGYSVLEVIKTFEIVSGIKLNYCFAPRRQGDVEIMYASTDLANSELNWFAEQGLKEMLLSAWQWQKKIKK